MLESPTSDVALAKTDATAVVVREDALTKSKSAVTLAITDAAAAFVLNIG